MCVCVCVYVCTYLSAVFVPSNTIIRLYYSEYKSIVSILSVIQHNKHLATVFIHNFKYARLHTQPMHIHLTDARHTPQGGDTFNNYEPKFVKSSPPPPTHTHGYVVYISLELIYDLLGRFHYQETHKRTNTKPNHSYLVPKRAGVKYSLCFLTHTFFVKLPVSGPDHTLIHNLFTCK